ncbi:MAG: PBP1A family penicillin-binding protein [Proteobacteria bacterium]|nr:PBP1A family penicillin-binding protein [Pseudomonadota bacterium]
MLTLFIKIITRLSFVSVILGYFCYLVYFILSEEVKKVVFLNDYKPPVSSHLYDKDLQKIRDISWEQRQYIAINAIPQKLIKAFIAAEDKHFYNHPGIDIFGIIRALLENSIKRSWGKKPIGASTITQQLAKNVVVGNQHSLERKIEEALTAVAIEYSFSKQKILELYLNEIFLGRKSYGVLAAAISYFNKDLNSLTLSECAYLASLPKAPGNYDIIKNREKALERKNWVLLRLYQDCMITKQEYEEAREDDLDSIIVANQDKNDLDYFSEQIRRDLLKHFGEHQLYGEGLTVITTQDFKLQKIAENVLKNHLLFLDKERGYRGPLVHIDMEDDLLNLKKREDFFKTKHFESFKKLIPPFGTQGWLLGIVLKVPAKNTDAVLIGLKGERILKLSPSGFSWVKKIIHNNDESIIVKNSSDIFKVGDVVLINQKGQKNYLEQLPELTGGLLIMDAETGAVLAMSGGFDPKMSHFNVVTQAKRQPGSCFKPFVYLAALEEGYTGNSIIDDAPIEIYLGPGQGYYKPQNITRQSYGPSPLRVGLEQSRNQMTINLALKIGMRSISDVAKRFGIYDVNHKEWSICLGAGETTMLKLTAAYAMIANGGKKITPHFISSIYNNSGESVYEPEMGVVSVCTHKEKIAPFNKDTFSLTLKPTLFDNRLNVIDKDVANAMCSFLKGAVEKGTARALKGITTVKKIDFCAKTGTTNDYKDAWCIGFTQNLEKKNNIVIAAFVGFPIPESMGKNGVGSRSALPMIQTFLKEMFE